MNDEGLTSIAVVDNGYNVVGNISTTDVKLLTSAANAPLLQSSCMHFISVNLSEKGMERGRDTFPVFYVNPYSTLAHTVAKLVATKSHRMWVVESASPSPSAPATPLLTPTIIPTTNSATQSPLPMQTSGASSVPAAALPGAHLSGRLTGVISLTDILNLFAKSTGLHPADPSEQRARRRRSSSSSVRPSIDSARPSFDTRRWGHCSHTISDTFLAGHNGWEVREFIVNRAAGRNYFVCDAILNSYYEFYANQIIMRRRKERLFVGQGTELHIASIWPYTIGCS